jgi:uncharacterized radical SAM protein YgiQ
MQRLGWRELDVILVTGDAYVDSPFIGAAVIGRVLAADGLRVGIIAQPDVDSDDDIARLGAPRLFWGVTGGSLDSMVANYTALLKRRRSDDLTPGGVNNRRPDRAVIVYANLIRRRFKDTAPIVLGGIEASLRRLSHYDYWSDRMRRSVLCDAKADILVYGMGEDTVRRLAGALRRGEQWRDIPGLCHMAADPPAGYLRLPDHETVAADCAAFETLTRELYAHSDPLTAAGLVQRQDSRFLVCNPPAPLLSGPALDAVYELPFQRELHPHYAPQGEVRALDTIRFSLVSHRGCYGGCRFCAIALHQGRTVASRSQASLLREARQFGRHPRFRGVISDVGGPTANMFGFECRRKLRRGSCPDRGCLYPAPCPQLAADHGPQLRLLSALRLLPGVRRVFVASGLRYDLLLADSRHGDAYLRALVRHHVSGQLKVAPEHTCDAVLQHMGKPPFAVLRRFRRRFEDLVGEAGRPLFLSYYFMAAHPGCTSAHMRRMESTLERELGIRPEQVQVFTPTPATWSTLMYRTGRDPFSGAALFVERSLREKGRQKKAAVAAGGRR